VLTDFEELGVYDCTTRPRPADKASHARIAYYRDEEYPDRWRELWDVFSREAVWSGAYDEYAASKRKRGTSEVDIEFLKEMEGWRDALAHNMAVRNANLSSDDLNDAVQLTIDRIVFLRMAEDRGLEPYEQLLKLTERPDIYSRFVREVCLKADEKYNSGLFHFQTEAGVSEAPDLLTPGLRVDDRILKEIVQDLYFAHGSPYHFGVLPVEILGTVYERFLGKVIRLTSAHHAKVEEKPEVRKAGGVYYTPAYVVDYIVKNTFAKHVKGRSPAQLAGRGDKAPFRVLDMACGSGSFLLGAYQFLLNHCLDWYAAHKPESRTKAVWKEAHSGEWRLTIDEKKRILTTHLFGVDIDRQAVEVTCLSLLLKVLEGEDAKTVGQQMELFHQRALPNLAENIRCGNSLVGPEYYVEMLVSDPIEIAGTNPLDWTAAFPAAIRAGGFDCIIGNPPYVRIQTMKEWAPREVEIYKRLYSASTTGNYDLYVVFVEKGLSLLKPNGRLGFICPHKFFNAKYGAPLREMISAGKHLQQVVHFGDQQVFADATTYTCLLFLDKAGVDACQYEQVASLTTWRTNGSSRKSVVRAETITSHPWNFAMATDSVVLDKIRQSGENLGTTADRIAQGIRTSANDVFVITSCRNLGGCVRGFSAYLDREVELEKDLLIPFLKGREIRAYRLLHSGEMVVVPYTSADGRASLIDEQSLATDYPLTYSYLTSCKKRLEGREHGRMKGTGWYAYVYPKNIEIMKTAKILAPDIADRPSFAFDSSGSYAFTSGYGLVCRGKHESFYLYLLAILNSKLVHYFLRSVSTPLRGGFIRYFGQYLEQIPLRLPGSTGGPPTSTFERMVELARLTTALCDQQVAANSLSNSEALQRHIEAIDAEIQSLVYELYGLTDSEISVVEEQNRL